MASNAHVVTIDVINVPEMVFMARQALANLLREEADAESDPRIARRLRQIAADFEVGTKGGEA